MAMNFNEHLKRIRAVSKTTQQDLADYLSISVQSVSKWEKGTSYPSIEFLPKIAEFYSCSVNAFFSDYELQAFEQFAPLDKDQEILLLQALLKQTGIFKDLREKEESEEYIEPEETLPIESLFLPALYNLLKENDVFTCAKIQINLGVGYGLAARILDAMEKMGIVVFDEEEKTRIVIKDKIDLLLPYFAYNKIPFNGSIKA